MRLIRHNKRKFLIASQNYAILYLRLLLLYRLWVSESGRKVTLAAFFVARFTALRLAAQSLKTAAALLRGSGLGASDSLIEVLSRSAADRKE